MTTISIFRKAAGITEGFLRTALNIRTSVHDYRLENYCKLCPMSHKDGIYKGTCLKENGGCGCNLTAKTAQEFDACPKGFFETNNFEPELFEEFLKENPIK